MRYHGKDLRKGRASEPGRPYLFTTVTRRRQHSFKEFEAARLLVHELQRIESEGRVESYAWVIMPDHIHWLFVLRDGHLSDVARLLKGRSTHSINKVLHTRFRWQSGYHDRAIRSDEDLMAVSRYIVANPLRAGLVADIGDYPFWDAIWLTP